MKNNIFDSRWRSIYSTNNSTLPLIIQLQSEPRSRIKLIANPTFSVYIIVLCPENASNYTVTSLNWIPGTEKMDTYRTQARFPVFEWVLYQEHTFTDKRQNTRNRRQTRFLPLIFFNLKVFIKGGPEPLEKESHEFLGSKRDYRFSNPFFWNGTKNMSRFVFLTCFGMIISVRARGHCESSRRSARR